MKPVLNPFFVALLVLNCATMLASSDSNDEVSSLEYDGCKSEPSHRCRTGAPITSLEDAITVRDVEAVEIFLQNGADACRKASSDSISFGLGGPFLSNADGPIARAVHSFMTDCSRFDDTQAREAMRSDWLRIIGLLIDHGADPQIGLSALFRVGMGKEPELAGLRALLLRRGANVNKAFNRLTPLICAAGTGNGRAVSQFLDHGARIDYQDERGVSALVAAALGEHEELVRMLIDRGAAIPDKQQREQLLTATRAETNRFLCEPPGPSENLGIDLFNSGLVFCDEQEMRNAFRLINNCTGRPSAYATAHDNWWPSICTIL